MGTSAFDSLWDGPGTPKKPKTAKPALASAGAFDSAWGADSPSSDPRPRDIHAEYQSGRLAKRMARENQNDAEALAAEEPSYAQKALGGIASLARDIPGAEYLQAGARSIVRGQPYDEARADIRSAEDAAPGVVRNVNRVAGGAIAALAMPKLLKQGPTNAVLQGAQYGALSGALSSDPNMGIKERGDAAIGQGTVGALAGKAGELVTNVGRAVASPSLGNTALARRLAMKEADKINYGAAEAEGASAAGRPTPKVIADALSKPDIAPYVDAVRASRSFANADDLTVLREAYKLMSERQGSLGQRIVNANDFKAGSSLEKQDVGLAKEELLSAAEAPGRETTTRVIPPMETAQSPRPTIRDAIAQFHANKGIAAGRREGTVAQQMARQALERHGAESVVSPSLRGAPAEHAISETVDTPAAMPSLRHAIQEHARMAGEREAFRTGADHTRRIASGAQVAGKNLEKNTPEAFAAAIERMKENQARAATEGVLGRAKDNVGLSLNPLTGFGVGKSALRVNRLAPYLQQLDQQTGGSVVANLMRALGISSAVAPFGNR